jgi:hypothetical protein
MTPKEIIEGALCETFQDQAGHAGTVKLAPPLTGEELQRFQSHQPAPLPNDIRELLRFTRGFSLLGERVDFRGEIQSESKPAFLWGIAIYHDGLGSFWVDVHPGTGAWSPILFFCDDPSILVIQSKDLAGFLKEFFNAFRPGRDSAVQPVYEVCLDIWRHNPGLRRVAEVRNSPDPILRAWIKNLKDDDYVADLRPRVIGSGFTWGCFGPDPIVKRYGSDLLFAIITPEGKGIFHSVSSLFKGLFPRR